MDMNHKILNINPNSKYANSKRITTILIIFIFLISFTYATLSINSQSNINVIINNNSITNFNLDTNTDQNKNNIKISTDLNIQNFINNSEILKSGPMVYVPGKSINVIDSNKLEIVGHITNDEIFEENENIWNVHLFQVAASPDGKYVYLAINYQEKSNSKGYGEHICKTIIVQLDASTQKIINWTHLKDEIIVKHIEVSPDSRVYVSYQPSWVDGYSGFYTLDFNQKKYGITV